LLGVFGNASRTNTPRNEGIRSFLTESVISKFDSGLFGNTIPSTEIIVIIILIRTKYFYNATKSLLSTQELNVSG